MKKFLVVALLASLLLNAVLLLKKRPEPPPAPPVVRTQIVERTLPAPSPPPAPPAPPAPRPQISEPVSSVPLITIPPAKPVVILLASPTYVMPDGDVTVSVTVLSGTPDSRDWIGVYAPGAGVSSYGGWQMMSAAPTFTFKAPAAPGEYEFRYVLSDNRSVVAASNPFRVLGDVPPKPQVRLESGTVTVQRGGEIPARWLVTGGRRSSRDWIGLYAPGAKNEDFLTWKYVTDADQGGVMLKAPDQPGTYEIRYLLNDGFESVAVSTTVVVTP